jgi:hypothetical protein
MGTTVKEVIAAHRAAGRLFEAAGLTTFVRAEGEGEPVVLLHGLPSSSSFLYRKVIGELAARGFAAMSFDLPGLGLADRPVGFDFTFAGLGRFAEAAVDALGLERFHLVVHTVPAKHFLQEDHAPARRADRRLRRPLITGLQARPGSCRQSTRCGT